MRSLLLQKDVLGFNMESRVFDVSSYSYAASVGNVLMTFATGGCLCIPSERDLKDDIPGTTTKLGANTVMLTPTAAQFLSPQAMPGLKSIIFVGEPLRVTDVKRWWGTSVRLVNRYGASECAASVTVNPSPTSPQEALRIGKGVSLVTWVVDPSDHDVLLPVGSIGELMLEGPTLFSGHLALHDGTLMTSTVENPAWLVRGSRSRPGRRGRLFKTGDLVRYCEDGNLIHVGRADTMIKIRGQRVELGEVESRVKDCMPEAVHIVAEVIVPAGNTSNSTLALFVQLGPVSDESRNGEEEELPQPGPKPIPDTITARLGEFLPSYMVPSLLFHLHRIPLTATGKTDRKTLREIGRLVTIRQLADVQTASREPKRAPRTEAEHQMQRLWSQILGIQVGSVGAHDSFFHLGGDSVSAMKVVSEARKTGLQISVADIFQHPKLSDIARHASRTSSPYIEISRLNSIGAVGAINISGEPLVYRPAT